MRGQTALATKTTKLDVQLPALARALHSIRWKELARIPHLASRHKLVLYRLATGCISGWDSETQRRGCPHCPSATSTGGDITHIFWTCPHAQILWSHQFDLWDRLGLDIAGRTHDDTITAAFSFSLPWMPYQVWRLHTAVAARGSEQIIDMHTSMQEARRQHCIRTISTIWRWRCGPTDHQDRWTQPQAMAYATALARSAWQHIADSASFSTRTPSTAIASVMMDLCAFSRDVTSPSAHALVSPSAGAEREHARPHKLLFFAGGSKGSPGPGGAGAILVETDDTGTSPRIAWCALFAYPHTTTTINYAAYQGVVEGLAEARRRDWRGIHIIGDNQLILDQLSRYRPPRQERLRHLYAQARRDADEVCARHFSCHLRAHNTMAATATTLAQDHGTSDTGSGEPPPQLAALLSFHLHRDVAQWRDEWFQTTLV